MPQYIDLRSNIHPLSHDPSIYQASDVYTSDVTGYSGVDNYYGFVNYLGFWIIIKEVPTSGTFRYASGESDYSTNWTNRAALSYDYYSTIV